MFLEEIFVTLTDTKKGIFSDIKVFESIEIFPEETVVSVFEINNNKIVTTFEQTMCRKKYLVSKLNKLFPEFSRPS